MDIEKAKKILTLTENFERYEKMLKNMGSGYSDEWEFKNSYTGATVDFSADDWTEIKTMIQKKHDESLKKIEVL
jgi:hypothetical protein